MIYNVPVEISRVEAVESLPHIAALSEGVDGLPVSECLVLVHQLVGLVGNLQVAPKVKTALEAVVQWLEEVNSSAELE